MDYCAALEAAIEKAPEGVWKEMLQIVYRHTGCDDGEGTVEPYSGGGTGGNPPTPPKNP